MDPNAALIAYWDAKASGDRSGAAEYRRALLGWIRGGGFEPTWSASGHTRLEFFSGRAKKTTSHRTITARDIFHEAEARSERIRR